MTTAELHGKVSGSGANATDTSEDLLTSNVFGCLRYVPPERALVPFLETAKLDSKDVFRVQRPVIRAYWSFWPYLQSPDRKPCEPDVVIGLESEWGVHLVMVEAKYFSDKSSFEDEGEHPKDQLARELDNLDILKPGDLGWRTQKEVTQKTLLYVTQDVAMPRNAIRESLSEYSRKRGKPGTIYWTSWRSLGSILEEQLQSLNDEYQAAVLNDIKQLLEKKGLWMFHGVIPPAAVFNPKSFVFYIVPPSHYDWPRQLPLLAHLPAYEYLGGKK
ncbi:MAG: hypothetical protein Q8O40_01830 [Chloroflexota bacterium]|nr:hypothetical protein [Chloroflexota bacterium]